MAQDFQMKVEEVFEIPGHGVVVRGSVQNGRVQVTEQVTVMTRQGLVNCSVIKIEKDRRLIPEAAQGGRVGLLLAGVQKEDITLGTLVTGLNR